MTYPEPYDNPDYLTPRTIALVLLCAVGFLGALSGGMIAAGLAAKFLFGMAAAGPWPAEYARGFAAGAGGALSAWLCRASALGLWRRL